MTFYLSQNYTKTPHKCWESNPTEGMRNKRIEQKRRLNTHKIYVVCQKPTSTAALGLISFTINENDDNTITRGMSTYIYGVNVLSYME